MNNSFWIYLLIMFGVTYVVRVLPMVAFVKKISNKYVKSFLAYVPYAVLASMTFPTVFFATGSVVTATGGVFVALLLASKGMGLCTVALSSSAAVLCLSLIVG